MANAKPHDCHEHDGQIAYMIERLQDLNFLHLFYFWVAVRQGSITAACEHLHLSQPTVSSQIKKLEKSLGHQLFDRSGREQQLTEVGAMVMEYADEIFSTGREMLGSLRGMETEQTLRLNVGVPMYVPKLITYRLLEVALRFPTPVQIDYHEAPMEQLVDDLVHHRHDVIISDRPIASDGRLSSFNHPLGDCSVAFCAVKPLAEQLRADFPSSLQRAPMLMPSPSTALRRSLDHWFDQHDICPKVVAQFDDSAMLKEFGSGGAGVFPTPVAVIDRVCRQYDVEVIGTLEDVRSHFFAITSQRRLIHPVVVAISEEAPKILLDMRKGNSIGE
ncbi:LysR family transcriptional regulator [Bremerella cremea]|uniref:LysR family transcriptional regulator n=2 Tax=Pirellulales TaxID=2691354 RepID=A0A2S8FBZ1_9BACT|nr:LysR family transcriptional regulator [Blastopirellula marina]RCS42768.1 LysR family transcriptional regulator [Bremerella cremea]